MKKLIWTVLIAFVLASMPVGGTAFAGQGNGKHAKSQAAKSGKHGHQKKNKKNKKARKAKQAKKAAKQAKAEKRGHKKA